MTREELNGVINFGKWIDKENVDRNINLNQAQKELIKLAIDMYCEDVKKRYGLK